jgi:microsomal dipeptidase-like Zn-dependent dipeptidase
MSAREYSRLNYVGRSHDQRIVSWDGKVCDVRANRLRNQIDVSHIQRISTADSSNNTEKLDYANSAGFMDKRHRRH